ncbi:hypothetical protein FGKAn22_10470 [Ferrigenium kumadai]|uniref:Uncharacterized protein n=1 Tax=Ferrigenium kumadai TaxID=1682490 RepID=A0AAN1T110_9PROT|nr:hypothetical protein [Ferrigenium kumadai]BBI99354.1 hypothetical protein FGKAn22_10470 [Ferrigenium kumadai]
MTTFADLFTSLKDELAARYRSPVWGAALIALAVYHWKVIVFFLTENPSAKDAIAFIEANVSGTSITAAIAIALCYVITFSWVELFIARTASFGKRARNDFHTEEREREIGRRKLIAQKQAQLIEIELKTKSDQSKLADIDLAKSYQNMLSGENFGRWLKDLQNGAINSSLSGSIFSYLNKVDTIEGKFINPEIELAHANFVSNLSSLGSALSEGGLTMDEARQANLIKFSRNVIDSQKDYRQKVRDLLGV